MAVSKDPTTPKRKNTTDIGPPPPTPLQSLRVHTTLTTTATFPRVDMVPPTVAVNQSGDDKEQPIVHRTRARRTTPLTSKPLPPIPEPVAECTHSQTASQGLTHPVAMEPRQAAQRCFPHEIILDWAMPVMDNVTGKTLEHSQLRRHPKYQKKLERILFQQAGTNFPGNKKSI